MSEQITKEVLIQTLNNLQSLTERLQTWNKLIKEMDSNERLSIESAIQLGTLDLSSLKFFLEQEENQLSLYKGIFDGLLKRFELPVLAYKQKIDEIINGEFKEKVRLFRIEAEEKAIKYAETLALNYRKDWDVKREANPYLSEKTYQNQCMSLVTVFLFQPPMLGCDSSDKRRIFHEAFADWKPNTYVLLFCKKLKELFAQS